MTYHEQAIFDDTVDARGQVLIPKGLRRVLELHPGDRVRITADSATQTITIRRHCGIAVHWDRCKSRDAWPGST